MSYTLAQTCLTYEITVSQHISITLHSECFTERDFKLSVMQKAKATQVEQNLIATQSLSYEGDLFYLKSRDQQEIRSGNLISGEQR